MSNSLKPRDYQERSVELVDQYFSSKPGNPCLVLPTGSGKSIVIALMVRHWLTSWPDTRILMLTHVKELIEQNAEKLRSVWPGAPLGVFSASLRRRELGGPITFAGIQSVKSRAAEIGHIDIVIVDECHLISHRDEGGYRQLIGELKAINPWLRVLGLTATPWRLGHGLITEGDAIFDDLIEPVSIEELISRGFLSPLRSKLSRLQLDTSNVKKRGGEYIEKQLSEAVDTQEQNAGAAHEILEKGAERRHWLVFCVSIEHAEHFADALRSLGVSCEVLTGNDPKKERERKIEEFKSGKIRAMVNVNVLTTGFDFPNIDLIALLRPTLSAVLYVQMVGRGTRLKSHVEDCLVLDFSDLVRTHGPITAVVPPKKKGQGKEGEAPAKSCPECFEIVPASARSCPSCGYEFPKDERKWTLSNLDIMGEEGEEMEVKEWRWTIHTQAATGRQMLRVDYEPDDYSSPRVSEFFTIVHPGQGGDIAWRKLRGLALKCGVEVVRDLQADCLTMDQAEPPRLIEFVKSGSFFRVVNRTWQSKQLSLSS